MTMLDLHAKAAEVLEHFAGMEDRILNKLIASLRGVLGTVSASQSAVLRDMQSQIDALKQTVAALTETTGTATPEALAQISSSLDATGTAIATSASSPAPDLSDAIPIVGPDTAAGSSDPALAQAV